MKYFKTREVKDPVRGTEGSAGIDFFVPDDYREVTLYAGQDENIPSGIHVKIPRGHVLVLMNKSGVCLNKKLIAGANVIDEDYQGEIHLHVFNAGEESEVIYPGEKLIQGVVLPVNYVRPVQMDSLEELYEGGKTERGEGGFGSTGVK